MAFLIDIIRSHYLLRKLRNYQQIHDISNKNEEQKPASEASAHQTHYKLRRIGRFFSIVFQDGTWENYVFRSILGYVSGVLLSLLLLVILVFQVKMSPTKAILLCVIITPFLTLGLAFSSRLCCISLILMPQLSSKRGRQALVACAYILALNGPMVNTMYNLEEISQSLSCTQEKTRMAMERLVSAAKQPLVTAKRAVATAMKSVKAGVAKLRASISAVERVVVSLLGVITSAGSWLSSVVNVCNRKMGTPTERCLNVFEGAAHDCAAHLGPLFSWLCSVVYVVSIVCHTMAWIGLLCKIVHVTADSASSAVKKTTARLSAYVRTALYVDVEFYHTFHVEIDTDNRTIGSVSRAIRQELAHTLEPIEQLYRAAGGLLGVTWIIVFIKSFQYHRKFMLRDRFDNKYITREVKKVDLTRAKRHLESVLPLRPAEKRKYCKPTRLRWLAHEKQQLTRSILFLFMSTINILIIIQIDYCLFWLLDHLRTHATFLTQLPPGQAITLEVGGDGLVPEMFRNISSSLNKEQETTKSPPNLDPSLCLPYPMQPDFFLYYKIMTLIALAWVLALIEPIVLRTRPAVLSAYYPERARKRAVWLCGHILRERSGIMRTFMKLATHHPSGKTKREPISFHTVIERLKDRFCLARFLFNDPQEACIACATAEGPFKKCDSFGCTARYCMSCFSERESFCLVCSQQIQQPQISGLQLERDSSDEELDHVTCVPDTHND